MSSRIKLTENKANVEFIIDRNLLSKIKEHSKREGRTISEIIHDALFKFINADIPTSELRRVAVYRFCSKPFDLSIKEINELLTNDNMEQVDYRS